MQKIIKGFGDVVVLEGEYNARNWAVRVWERNGHREISARNTIDWTEVEECYRRDMDPPKSEKVEAALAEERRLKSLEKSANRSKTECRRIIKAEGFNEMLTLTYRENQMDRALCKKHFKEWARRMKRALGGFRYCAAFERQERGAMHVHVACHRLPQYGKHGGVKIPAWRLGTKIWRSIVGEDNGMCFVGGKTKFGTPGKKQSMAAIAAYVSKYILKDYADVPSGSNRYSRSEGLAVARPVTMYFNDMSAAEVIALCFQCDDGDVIVSSNYNKLSNAYWLCTEPSLAPA